MSGLHVRQCLMGVSDNCLSVKGVLSLEMYWSNPKSIIYEVFDMPLIINFKVL